jgi:predicted Ser/Thr protein kinase
MPADAPHLSALSGDARRELEQMLAEFGRSWDEQRLAAQLRRLPADSPLRPLALCEMVKVDLERRWQRGRKVLLDAYLKSYPELGTAETLPADLVWAEFRVRQRFGSRADLAEYQRRFPNQADELRRLAAGAPDPPAAPEAAVATRATGGVRDSTRVTAGRVAPTVAPEPSGQFGRYRILRKLGQGGMGAVYLAHDEKLDRQVALKVPRFGPDDGPEMLERFEREARAAATVSHPNICPVYDVGEVGGVHFVTMAYVEGRPLSGLVQPGKPLPQRPVAALVRKLALAMEEAHRRGVVHRDLKPSNVMVDRRREPVVMDFGLARRAGAGEARLTRGGTVLGTPAYMSPEQARGDADVGPASDVYALGVVLYELLTGRLPFEGAPGAVLAQVLTKEPPAPSKRRPDLDSPLEAVCRKAMAKEPAARYRSMREMADDLGRYLQGQGVEPAQPAAGKRAGAKKAGASGAGDEGLATQLLARLVDRLETSPAQPAAAAVAGRPGGSRWVPLLGAVAVLGVAAGVFFFLTRGTAPRVENTVVVQLAGLAAHYDPAVIFILDGKPVSREELAEPIRVRTGDHELVVKRGDIVLETRKFSVGTQDEGKKVQLPPSGPDVAAKPAPKPAEGETGRPPAEPTPVPGEPSPAAQPLVEKLRDEDYKVRLQAATSLKELKDPSAAPALIRRVSDDLWHGDDNFSGASVGISSKGMALEALRAIAPDRVTEALLKAAKAEHSKDVRRWACLQLASLGKDPKAAAGLVDSLKDEEPEVRTAAAESLAAMRPPVAKPLADALFDEQVAVRRQAAASLQKLGDYKVHKEEVIAKVAEVAVPALIRRVSDDLWHGDDNFSGASVGISSKGMALEALRTMDRAKVTPALVAAMSAGKEEVRVWACGYLAQQKDKQGFDALVAAAKGDKAPRVREAATAALSQRK